MATQFDPMAEFTTAQAAEIMGVSEEFLFGLLAKAVKQGIVKMRTGWKVAGSDISRLGKTYYRQIESAQHQAAYLRVRARDEAELHERLERGKQHE